MIGLHAVGAAHALVLMAAGSNPNAVGARSGDRLLDVPLVGAVVDRRRAVIEARVGDDAVLVVAGIAGTDDFHGSSAFRDAYLPLSRTSS